MHTFGFICPQTKANLIATTIYTRKNISALSNPADGVDAAEIGRGVQVRSGPDDGGPHPGAVAPFGVVREEDVLAVEDAVHPVPDLGGVGQERGSRRTWSLKKYMMELILLALIDHDIFFNNCTQTILKLARNKVSNQETMEWRENDSMRY